MKIRIRERWENQGRNSRRTTRRGKCFFREAPRTEESTCRTSSRILGTGFPRNIGGFDYAVAMCNALGIHFDFELLDCDPFYHGYGMNCSEDKLKSGIWKLPLADLHGTRFELPFYLVQGDGYLSLR